MPRRLAKHPVSGEMLLQTTNGNRYTVPTTGAVLRSQIDDETAEAVFSNPENAQPFDIDVQARIDNAILSVSDLVTSTSELQEILADVQIGIENFE